MALMEAKVDDAVKKAPEHTETLKRINEIDPKFLDWSVKQLKAGARAPDLIGSLKYFRDNIQRFPKKDIAGFKSLKDLEDTVKSISSMNASGASKGATKKAGVEKLYSDDEFEFIYIKNKAGAVGYGKGTKWCITMSDAFYFEEHSGNNVIFYYLISKKRPPDDPLQKVAFAVYRNMDNSLMTPYDNDEDDKHNYGIDWETYDDDGALDNVDKQFEIFDAEDNSLEVCPTWAQRFLNLALEDAPRRPTTVDANKKREKKDLLTRLPELDDATVAEMIRNNTINSYATNKFPPNVVRVAMEMASSESEEDGAIIYSINIAGRFLSKDVVKKLLSSDNIEVRGAAAGRAPIEYIELAARDPDPGVRLNSLERLVAADRARWLPIALNDPTRYVAALFQRV